eukprot:GHVO01002296.1.p1 GENE.GHVO01002296.1~~GHVO01002296.1.p1  ORF type:complete len:1070 (-),score=175.65 GHVO01002296.1:379-3588(-)
MKKTKPNERPSSGSSSSSRSGSERTNGSRKASAAEKSSKPLTKALSKSHDNLASQLRRKAAQANLANVKDIGRVGSPATSKFKTPKNPSTPIRKAQSTPSIENSLTPIKRTQSEQNISKSTPKRPQTAEPKSSAVKRASSSHNVSSPKVISRQARASTQVSAMAYNAELLASFEKEKKALERRISELIQTGEERKTEIEKLKFRVKNLQEDAPEGDIATELSSLRGENSALKGKLCDLGVRLDPYTDSEKISLLRQANGHRDECDAGPCDSVSVTCTKGAGSHLGGSEPGGELVTPESEHISFCPSDFGYPATTSLSMDNNWDKQSNKSSDGMSEISVACLQDRILQMEETHYSTHEELQATLQELGDLQDAVNELTCENESLADEKSVLLESLCAQTEKLENARMQVEHLKVLLVTNSDDHDRSENERQLMGLIKSAQEEKEELLLKQMEYGNVLHSLETENRELQDVVTALRDKARILEMKNESLTTDKRVNEKAITDLREQAANDQIELQTSKTLLENEKQKASELEQERNATDKTDLEELLDATRIEKEKLEERLAFVQEQLAMSQNEAQRCKENISSLEEEVKVCKNNAKTEMSDLQYSVERIEREKAELRQQGLGLRDHIDSLQLECDRLMEDQKTHSSAVSSLETELQTLRKLLLEKETALREIDEQFREEKEEWGQFQADLQTAVVIANNIKSETQEDMEQIVSEKQALREENRAATKEINRLREELDAVKLKQRNEATNLRNDIRGRVLSSVDRELTAIRQGRKVSDPRGGNPSLSVKHIINSIELTSARSPGPQSPLSPTDASPRRNSESSTDSKLDSPVMTLRPALDRSTSAPAPEGVIKGVLKRSSTEGKENRPAGGYRHSISDIILETPPTPEEKLCNKLPATSPNSLKLPDADNITPKKPLTGILANKKKSNKSEPDPPLSPYGTPTGIHGVKTDPLAILAKQMGGSKRNALLKWCQNKTNAYSNIDITNFSSSWNDGLAFSALMHSYLPEKIPYRELTEDDKMRNFSLAFKAAESVGIPSTLNLHDMVAMERPDWQAVMHYITSIYKHFEVDRY